MQTTIIVLLLIGGLQLASFLFWMVMLRVGLRWVKVRDVSWRRLALAALLAGTLSIIPFALRVSRPTFSHEIELVIFIAELGATLLIPCLVIKWIFKTSLIRSLQAWFPTLLSEIVNYALVLLVLRPFLIESFMVTSNAMAPTLLGNHWKGVCEECGNPAYCSVALGQFDQRLMICDRNFHITQPTTFSEQVLGADRMLVSKFLKPRRWDVVVFKSPGRPQTLSVMRVVGMPGEEIIIRDGQVWADGLQTNRPESITGIKYLAEMDLAQDLSGVADNPAKLADDEYFVLGDFSARSMDSRLWTEGAQGHPRYAVPASHICGVVTHIYWPITRMRILR